MFPLNWNIPFIRKNGSRTTLGAITGDIAGIEEDVADLTEKTDGLFDNMLENGAVNFLPDDATTQTISGVTFTVNGDKTVTANGTATENLELVMTSTLKLENKTYKLTGCPSGGSATTYKIDVQIVDGAYPAQDVGRGATFTASSSNTYKIRIRILSGVAVSNLTFKPMLSDPALNLSYNDYVPFAKSNMELTVNVNSLDLNKINGTFQIGSQASPVSIFDILQTNPTYPNRAIYMTVASFLSNGQTPLHTLLSINQYAVVRITKHSGSNAVIEIMFNDEFYMIGTGSAAHTTLKFVKIASGATPSTASIVKAD